MLIVGREIGQSVRIGNDIKVTVLDRGYGLRLSIDAPKSIRVSRLKQSPQKKEGNDKRMNRKIGDAFLIGDNVEIALIRTNSGCIRFAIDAPKEIRIFREEIYKGFNSINC